MRVLGLWKGRLSCSEPVSEKYEGVSAELRVSQELVGEEDLFPASQG